MDSAFNQEISHESLDFWRFWQIIRSFHQWGKLSSRFSLRRRVYSPGRRGPPFGCLWFPCHVISLCCLECGPIPGAHQAPLQTYWIRICTLIGSAGDTYSEVWEVLLRSTEHIPNQGEHRDCLGSFCSFYTYVQDPSQTYWNQCPRYGAFSLSNSGKPQDFAVHVWQIWVSV